MKAQRVQCRRRQTVDTARNGADAVGAHLPLPSFLKGGVFNIQCQAPKLAFEPVETEVQYR